jgi:hypothetical protein
VEEDEAVLTGAWAVTKRWHDGAEERRWLELITRAKEGMRELRREGKKGRWGPGVLVAFYKGWGSAGEGWPGW